MALLHPCMGLFLIPDYTLLNDASNDNDMVVDFAVLSASSAPALKPRSRYNGAVRLRRKSGYVDDADTFVART